MKRWCLAGVLVSLIPLVQADATAPAGVGQRIAEQGTPQGAAPCASCHGPDGSGNAEAGYPRIAGLGAGYLEKQLRDLASGQRNNPVMHVMAMHLNDAEIAAVAGYYSDLPAPQASATLQQDDGSQMAADLITWGDWVGRRLPACARCHGPDGNGIGAHFPGLAGQQQRYLESQLRAWRQGQRTNDPLGMMRRVAQQLTDAEIRALAADYAALPPGRPTPAPNAPEPGFQLAAEAALTASAQVPSDFQPPARNALPSGPLGAMIGEGQAIFLETYRHPASAQYVGNKLACVHCHLDTGRLAGSAPMWAAWIAYPAYRNKTKQVDSFAERLQGCFTYSLNAEGSSAGAAPSLDSEPIRALAAYAFWLAQGAPTGATKLPGRGYPRLEETPRGFDPQRGEQVYATRCALCHGSDGAGVISTEHQVLFPPLWGPQSYNWGAGMQAIDTAAAFIKANMPLGIAGALTDQEAWDVAAFVDAQQRPQDPRFTGDLQETAKRFHSGRFSLYGQVKGPDGRILGAGR
ncbi:c-type cytochrome [Thiorhodococcus mannitoliphagus]|uniref:C-type cytochrome n=1 Tax=Thiorhodococcus mannitoliphagus TaxID=329406 RepID=A0A6P1E069_9GAMM|nr:c-type cytochrome [Thiorhodococcus mannitoliphagus]NEX22683.1 c-type cytochrome [Thiorhodococcus mannitoliphagus]